MGERTDGAGLQKPKGEWGQGLCVTEAPEG